MLPVRLLCARSRARPAPDRGRSRPTNARPHRALNGCARCRAATTDPGGRNHHLWHADCIEVGRTTTLSLPLIPSKEDPAMYTYDGGLWNVFSDFDISDEEIARIAKA